MLPMFTRRAALISAAATALMLATPAFATNDLKLPRQKVELVAPPFVHAHEQATRQGPKIMEFKLVVAEKKVVIDEQGTTFQAMTFNGSMRSEEHTSEIQSLRHLVCRLLLEKKK